MKPKSIQLILFLNLIIGLYGHYAFAQNNTIKAYLNNNLKEIVVEQEITFTNSSNIGLSEIVLNDWNNAFSSNTTPLAKRFSDEFVRSFHYANHYDKGKTTIQEITDSNNSALTFSRTEEHPDLLKIALSKVLNRGESVTVKLKYNLKIPNDKFTRYGYTNNDGYVLRSVFLSIARLEKDGFIQYSNENLDDISNTSNNYNLWFEVEKNQKVFSDLNQVDLTEGSEKNTYHLSGNNRNDFTLYVETKPTFFSYKNGTIEVVTNLKEKRLNEIQKALVIDKISNYLKDELGTVNQEKIVVSQTDYENNPFYGLNQLPAFISPFPDTFIYELKFLKVYTDQFLKAALKMNQRKDTWVYDGLQTYLLMKYINENYPDMKMMGNLSHIKILKGYNIFNNDFNDQFTYVYLLMARKNLDQPIGDEKNTFIKFNEKIANRYRAGLSLNYLNDYLGENILSKTIHEFIALNKTQQTDDLDFEKLLKQNTSKNIDWFHKTLVNTNNLIDFKITHARKKGENLEITIKNKVKTNVPISIYGIKNDSIVFKQWVENISKDSTFEIKNQGIEKLVLNYKKEVPEYNTRNNWKDLNSFFGNNRPFKFNFIKDLENSDKNQVFYRPEFSYNLYDGFCPGISLNNKSFLDKPFIFDATPIYSSKTKQLIGGAFFTINRNVRGERLFNIKYTLGGNTYHYAPNAAYYKISPSINFSFRDLNYRSNKREYVTLRHIFVDRQQSAFATKEDQNYSVFNLRYLNINPEVTNYYKLMTDAQVANNFGKLAGEIQFRRLFNNNRQINVRMYSGFFLFKSTSSNFFDFGLSKPTDYLFDYNFLGRSESSGLFSQQFIMAEGGFKTFFDTRLSNQWMTTVNASFNVWNWVEIYGDVGTMKNKYQSAEFLYDSGIRLNLVPDYFELYLPVYSKNGWEINEDNYSKKIRFVITLSPKTLVSLFTRKWL